MFKSYNKIKNNKKWGGNPPKTAPSTPRCYYKRGKGVVLQRCLCSKGKSPLCDSAVGVAIPMPAVPDAGRAVSALLEREWAVSWAGSQLQDTDLTLPYLTLLYLCVVLLYHCFTLRYFTLLCFALLCFTLLYLCFSLFYFNLLCGRTYLQHYLLIY